MVGIRRISAREYSHQQRIKSQKYLNDGCIEKFDYLLIERVQGPQHLWRTEQGKLVVQLLALDNLHATVVQVFGGEHSVSVPRLAGAR